MKRGHALATGAVYKQIKWEMNMKRYIQENEETIVTPKDAFITFATEEAYWWALGLETVICCGNLDIKKFWRDSPIDFKICKEPSNIVYENLY